MSGYLRHIELSKQLEERAKEASRNRQLAEEKLGDVQKLLEGAKKADCQVSEAEELIAQANSAMAAKDYKLALEKTKDAEDKLKAAFLQKAQSIIDSAESILGLLKRAAVDTTEHEALVGSAKDALERGNLEEAVEAAKRGWSKGEKTLHEYLSDSFSSAQALILAAKAMGRDVSMAEDLLSTARDALESSDYEEALTHTEEALDILRRELNYELEEEKKAVAELMEAGKAIKADLSKAESYLSRSQKELAKQDFEKAFNLLKQARTEAERKLKKTIESGEASLRGPLEEAKKLGADVRKAERLVEEALEVAKSGDYATASKIIRRAVHELEDAKFQKVLHTISLSRPKFLKAREIGADVSAAVEVFNKSRETLQAGNYKDALYYAQKGNEELDRLVGEFSSARQKMEELEREVRSFSEAGVQVGEVETLLKTAREELSQGNLMAWSSLVSRIERGLEKARSQRTSEILEEAQFLLTLGEKLGLVLSEESENLHECSQALKAGEIPRAFQEAGRLKDKLEERISSHFREKLEDVKGILPEGEEAKDISELILKAEAAMEVKDYEMAARLTDEAYAKAEEKAISAASQVLRALQAAQQLAADHDIDVYGLRESHLAAKRAMEEGRFAEVFEQHRSVEEQMAQVATSAFEGVKARVIEARDAGLEIEDLKGLLKRAKEAITSGDIVRGLIHLRGCDSLAVERLGLFQKVRDTMASAAVLIAEGKKKKVDMSRAVELLVKGKTAFEAGDLKRALGYARDARAEAEKEISVLNVTDRITTAREVLELAKMLEVDVSVWTNLLKRAQQSLNAKDFREAVELAMEVEEQAKAGIRNKINSKVARAEALLERVQVPAKEVDSLQEAIVTARNLAEEGKLKEAAETIQEALEGCEELAQAYEGTLEVVRRAEQLVAELKAMSVRVSGPEKLLNKAKKVLQEGNLKHAGQLAEEALNHLERDRQESIEKTIKSFENAVAKARSSGVNTSTAEELLRKARGLLEEGRYQDALAAAMQSEAEVEKMELQKEIAENALETARSRIMALPSPVPFLTKLLEEAEQAFEKGDYVASLEASIQAGDEFSRIKDGWEQVENSEEVALKFYRIAEKIGVQSAKLGALLEEAKQAMEKGDLEGAREAYDILATQAAGLVSSHLTQLHSHVRNLQVLCSLLNCDIEGLEDRLSQGRSYTDENQFDKAYEVLSKAKEEAESVLKRRIQELISAAEKAIEHAEKLGADVHHARNMVKEARKDLEEGMFERAIRLTQEATDLVKGLEDFHKSFMEATFRAETLIKTAKKFGIDVKAAEQALNRAFELKDSDPDAALSEAEASLVRVQSSLDAFSPDLNMELDLKGDGPGTWQEAVLKIRNSGKALAKDLQVEILGDLDVEEVQAPAAIRANGEVEVRFKARFRGTGTLPIMVKVRAKRVLDDREYEWEQVFEVLVEGGPSRQEARAIIAEYDSRCVLCRGAIKKGFAARECACGALLHEPCALRSGKCPSCQGHL